MSTTLTAPSESTAVAARPAAATSFDAVYRRITRRETHSPRSLLAITLAVVIIVVFLWIGTEIVIAELGAPALLVNPDDALASAVALAEAPAAIVAAAGIGIALVGLLLVIAALAPGRRARHVLSADRAAVVVDNEVIASALARHTAYAGNVDPDNVTVSVSHTRAVIDLLPTSGVPVDRAVVTEVVDEQLESYGLRPRVSARVRIAENGRIGV